MTDDEMRLATAPAGEQLVLRTDGASRGNPGHAAAGVVLQYPDGTLLTTGKLYLGVMTNNQAEYRALILGLKTAQRYKPAALEVCMDSELVVAQMAGRYRVRDVALAPLYAEALARAGELGEVRFTHVRRALNGLADRLANEALDERAARGPRA